MYVGEQDCYCGNFGIKKQEIGKCELMSSDERKVFTSF